MGQDNKVQRRDVKLGAIQKLNTTEHEMRVIESGIEAGDLVVVKGIQRVRPGTLVRPHFENDETTAAGPATPGAAVATAAPPEPPER